MVKFFVNLQMAFTKCRVQRVKGPTNESKIKQDLIKAGGGDTPGRPPLSPSSLVAECSVTRCLDYLFKI